MDLFLERYLVQIRGGRRVTSALDITKCWLGKVGLKVLLDDFYPVDRRERSYVESAKRPRSDSESADGKPSGKKVKGADSKREKPSPTIASVDKDSKRDARDNATEKQICLKHLGYTMGVDDCECKLSS